MAKTRTWQIAIVELIDELIKLAKNANRAIDEDRARLQK